MRGLLSVLKIQERRRKRRDKRRQCRVVGEGEPVSLIFIEVSKSHSVLHLTVAFCDFKSKRRSPPPVSTVGSCPQARKCRVKQAGLQLLLEDNYRIEFEIIMCFFK